jgi:formylglycine-generating enzyme required for sulfatase activity
MGKQFDIKKIIIPTVIVLFGVTIFLLLVNKNMDRQESGLFVTGQSDITETRSNVNTENSVSGSFEYGGGEIFIMENPEYEAYREDRVSNINDNQIGTNLFQSVSSSVSNISSNTENTPGLPTTTGTGDSTGMSVTGTDNISGEPVISGTNASSTQGIEASNTDNTSEVSSSIIGTTVESSGTVVQTGAAEANSTGEASGASGTSANSSTVTTAQTGAVNANNAVSSVSSNAENIPPPPPPHPPEKMELLKGGSFYMGSPVAEEERDEDEVQHYVTVKPFYIGKYEVTQLEYREVMGKNPSYFKGPNLPVETVSWFDAIEYCIKLSLRHNLTPAYKITGNVNNRAIYWDKNANGYRLPTEEEWEYACRAGTTTPFNTGRNISRSRANYFGRGTVNVGIYLPNIWGLYDMHGNVAEWCWDKYQGYEYTPPESHMDSMEHRVLRGGSWFTMTMRMRSAFRDHANPSHKNQAIGFRIVRNE